MEIRFSPLFSGSSGNATYVGCDDANILVDAGATCCNVLGDLASAVAMKRTCRLPKTHKNSLTEEGQAL